LRKGPPLSGTSWKNIREKGLVDASWGKKNRKTKEGAVRKESKNFLKTETPPIQPVAILGEKTQKTPRKRMETKKGGGEEGVLVRKLELVGKGKGLNGGGAFFPSSGDLGGRGKKMKADETRGGNWK